MNQPTFTAAHEQSEPLLRTSASIIRYFIPECITALVLYTLVGLFDAACIAYLKSTNLYAILGVTNTLTFFITKVAEGFSVAAVILCGQYQGRGEYAGVGRVISAVLWLTAILGGIIGLILYAQAGSIYRLLCIPEELIELGIPFMKVRAVGIGALCIFLGLVGCLRGIKNTRAVMYCYLLGSATFVAADYLLIFGWGSWIAPLGFQGSAIAFTLQYMVMCCAAFLYLFLNHSYRHYQVSLWSSDHRTLMARLCQLSWPVMFDKAALQVEKLWTVRLLAPMGSFALGALNVLKDLETLAFVPAVAFGQVVTLLVSNEYGGRRFKLAKQIIKLTLAMTTVAVLSCWAFFAWQPQWVIGLFDRQGFCTAFVAQLIPIIGVLVIFDLLQLVLAGALRGSGKVQVVMWTRVISCLIIFLPLSSLFATIPVDQTFVRFVTIYGTYNLVNALVSGIYIYWFGSGRWLPQQEGNS